MLWPEEATAYADSAATKFITFEGNRARVAGEVSQMVAECPNTGAVRDQDRRGIIRWSRGGRFVPIVAHRITLTDIVVEFREYPDGLAGLPPHLRLGNTRGVLVGGIFRTLLRNSGLGLKLQGRVRSALVSRVLSFD